MHAYPQIEHPVALDYALEGMHACERVHFAIDMVLHAIDRATVADPNLAPALEELEADARRLFAHLRRIENSRDAALREAGAA